MAKIERILSLGSREFLTGLAPGPYFQNSGVFFSANGFNPVSDFDNGSNQGVSKTGLLQTYCRPTVSSTLADVPFAATTRNGTTLYMIGDAGHLYQGTTDKRSGTPITNPAKGIFTYKPQAGTEYLYYLQTTQIGRWDLSGAYPTGWTDNHFTGLQSTTLHFVHPFGGDVYYTNLDRIGKVYENAGTAANNTNVLDFPSDYVAIALENDGTYLVASLTKATTGNTTSAENKIIFWDTFSPSWNKEISWVGLPIVSLKRIGPVIYGVTGEGLYVFNFDSDLKKVAPVDIDEQAYYGDANVITAIGEAVVWGANSNTSISTVGKLNPSVSFAHFRPFGGLGGYPRVLIKDAYNQLTVAGHDKKVYTYNLAGGSAGSPAGINFGAQTVYFDLKDIYDIKRVDLIFGNPLTTSVTYGDDYVGIDIYKNETESAISFGAADYANPNHAGKTRVELYKDSSTTLQTDTISLSLESFSNNPQLKRIDVYGERVSTI